MFFFLMLLWMNGFLNFAFKSSIGNRNTIDFCIAILYVVEVWKLKCLNIPPMRGGIYVPTPEYVSGSSWPINYDRSTAVPVSRPLEISSFHFMSLGMLDPGTQPLCFEKVHVCVERSWGLQPSAAPIGQPWEGAVLEVNSPASLWAALADASWSRDEPSR